MHTSELSHKLSSVDDFIRYFRDCVSAIAVCLISMLVETLRAAAHDANQRSPEGRSARSEEVDGDRRRQHDQGALL